MFDRVSQAIGAYRGGDRPPGNSENFRECISLELEPSQARPVAPNVESLAEAKVDPTLVPLAVYDRAALGNHHMVGFIMYTPVAAVDLIEPVMIDKRYQRQGYGRAAMRGVIRSGQPPLRGPTRMLV